MEVVVVLVLVLVLVARVCGRWGQLAAQVVKSVNSSPGSIW